MIRGSGSRALSRADLLSQVGRQQAGFGLLTFVLEMDLLLLLALFPLKINVVS